MKRKELHIAEPCSADWDEMTGDDRKRFCSSCTKHVHNVSELTEGEARALFSENNNLCVQYAFNREGKVLFADTPDPTWRLFRQAEGLKRLMAAAALVMPLALASACEPDAASTTESVASSPLVIEEGGVKIQEQNQGAGRSVEFKPSDPKPQPEEIEVLQGEPEIDHEMVVGKVAIDPEEKEPIEHVKGEMAPIEEQEEEIEVLRGDVAFEPETHSESKDDEAMGCDGEGKDTSTSSESTAASSSAEPEKQEPIRKLKGRVASPRHHK
jgi:hypothetical protein